MKTFQFEEKLASAAGQEALEAHLFSELQKEASDKVEIVELARGGLVPADRALRKLIDEAMKANRFDELPLSVRYYALLLLRAGRAD